MVSLGGDPYIFFCPELNRVKGGQPEYNLYLSTVINLYSERVGTGKSVHYNGDSL
jgi:hypothetical protein